MRHRITKILISSALVIAGQIPYNAFSESIGWRLIKTSIRIQFPSVAKISIQELADWLLAQERDKPLLLDSRGPDEYAVSHLVGAIPAASLEDAIQALVSVNKTYPIVVYCSVGYRSAKLAEKLQAAGFSNVYNLEGSIFEWANSGKSVYRGQDEVFVVHPYNSVWGKLLDEQFHPEVSE